ncbi:MAG: helix-turn-helix transcriptional regulator [Lentimicrobiaceae bacterium]|jgi:putative transcriptional regulator|nr:helix-turn-helix transcriptional regulator [Lentimicrobiaceae bacterium]MBT3818139.1 helix-turn-helix transcriptional regulator [Lentimicrobiaceae bacterium]MBT4061442.1 helix-turn-helix transcriptional regulator [Lentimicrobiaceae bacterium]MBT4191180.1 helix-turn-helix transcriptional regulator [Lentimicrobiaceae bacterium]MBT4800361.1 helix-turn-helix transcriptional regulator [Lentimicrobiaceae bacterium]
MSVRLKNRVREFRQQKNLTQEELGNKVGVSRQTIISIEKYKYKPSLELAMKISLEIGEKIETLFYFEA